MLFKGLSAERLARHRGPLYGLFESEFGTRMIRAQEQIRAVAADAANARLLQVAKGTPLLLVERVSFTYGDRPVEVRRGLCVTAEHHYRNALY
jgi:GntR family transcriptional regulator